ncbi:MAG: bifunctional cbb3-type cytochrome c oxidase subunit, partial [Adhaeribacter sp.]|nr:bifunctional cbb3-type cytochrome c oxidase subunit [Adhaeribacter sp.]
DQKLDITDTEAKIEALQKLGTPYPAGYAQKATKDLQIQARKITDQLAKEGIEVNPDREIVALIAYLQRLGTDIKVKEETAAVK